MKTKEQVVSCKKCGKEFSRKTFLNHSCINRKKKSLFTKRTFCQNEDFEFEEAYFDVSRFSLD